ncbi:MAG: hypothetical protein QXK76_02240 [Candidatus Woesearchaeota archaeon]
MDDYVALHICDPVFPKDIPLEELQNKIILSEEIEGQEFYTLIRNPDSINSNYISDTYRR